MLSQATHTQLGATPSAPPALLDHVLSAIERDGYVVLTDYFDESFLKALERESAALLSSQASWFKRQSTEKETQITLSPEAARAAGALGEIKSICESFEQPVFLTTANRYLPSGAYVDRVIVHRCHPNPAPITEWHADQQRDGRLSLKFMLYLNDIDEQNGAFCYVPGSHRLVRRMMERLQLYRPGAAGAEVHHFAQIRDLALQHGLDQDWDGFTEMTQHIQGDYQSDDHFAIRGKRGSIVVFDTKGVHRGGIVRQGHRDILRVHYFEPESMTLPRRLASRARRFFLGPLAHLFRH